MHLLDIHLEGGTNDVGRLCLCVTVNVVIAGYVLAAFSEEDDTTAPGDESGPRVGAFKMRTD